MKFSVIKQAVQDKARDSGIDSVMLERWINNGYQDVVNKLIVLYENYFGNSADIPIIAGTQEYVLDTLCRKVVRIENENKDKVFRVSVDDNDSDVAGYYLWAGKIGFKPIPTTSKTYKYFFIKQPADLVFTAAGADPEEDPEVNDIPAFPSSYHHLLVLWGLKEYYENQQDIAYATHYFNQYNAKLAELINEMKERNQDEHKYAEPRYKHDDSLEWSD